MQLIIEDPNPQSASIPVRWCLHKINQEWLTRENADPNKTFILVSIVNDEEETDRYLIPLGELMTYIVFSKPGVNVVNAVIVVGKKHHDSKYYTRFVLDKTGSEYTRRALSYDNSFIDCTAQLDCLFNLDVVPDSATQFTANVDKKFFAPEPFDWSWVNYWFETEPANQCQLRRRRFIAYTIQPPAVLLWEIIFLIIWCGIWRTLCKTVAAISMIFWGIKPNYINWPALNPLVEMGEITDKPDRISWDKWRHRDQFEGYDQIRPVVIIFLLGMIILLNPWASWSPPDRKVSSYVLFSINFGLILGILGSVIRELWLLIVPELAFKISSSRKKLPSALATPENHSGITLKLAQWEMKFDAIAKQRKEQRALKVEAAELQSREQARLEREKTLKLASCEIAGHASLDALPPEKVTIWLQFQDLKAKVCKPYARH